MRFGFVELGGRCLGLGDDEDQRPDDEERAGGARGEVGDLDPALEAQLLARGRPGLPGGHDAHVASDPVRRPGCDGGVREPTAQHVPCPATDVREGERAHAQSLLDPEPQIQNCRGPEAEEDDGGEVVKR